MPGAHRAAVIDGGAMSAGRPVALTIAGSDSGGGAGIQADLKTFHAFGVFGTTALTAVTVQNTLGVSGIHPVPLDVVRGQIGAVAVDLPPAACKTGMLATAELVRAVADAIEAFAFPHFVLDPVMVASSGDRLLDEEAEAMLRDLLLPFADLVTPNLHEAAILTGEVVDGPDGMRAAARALVGRGARAALVKGGHLPGDRVLDVFWDGTEMLEWEQPKLPTRHTHGTGCTLSAAIAAGLAHGRPAHRAVADALTFVHRAIEEAPELGTGHGPLNHFVEVEPAR